MAQATSVGETNRLTEILKIVQVRRLPLSGDDDVKAIFKQNIAHATWSAIPATFLNEEFHKLPGDFQNVSTLAEYHYCPAGGEIVVADRPAKIGWSDHLPAGSTGLVYITDNGNMIAGLYTIASKVSDDAVLLTVSAGADTTSAVTADPDPGFTSETDGSEDYTPISGSVLTLMGLQVEVK